MNRTNLKTVWNTFRKKPMAIIGTLMLFTIIFLAIFAPLIAPYDPYETIKVEPEDILAPPDANHLLGRDDAGKLGQQPVGREADRDQAIDDRCPASRGPGHALCPLEPDPPRGDADHPGHECLDIPLCLTAPGVCARGAAEGPN